MVLFWWDKFFFLSDLDFIYSKEQIEFVRNRVYAYI